MDVLRPECDPEGDWAAVQCTGSDVCRWGDYMVRRVVIMMMVSRCVSKSTGEPIFGLSTNMTSVDMDLMTCDCARHAYMMKEMGCAMEVKWDGDTESSRRRYKEAFTKCMEREDAGYFLAGHLRLDNRCTQI